MTLRNSLLEKIFLVLICIGFLITRFYKVSDIPASVYWDEASIGYNAFSIVQTGKDEWGDFFPIHFRAFGEFKLPVYIYSTVAAIKVFGLNELSVRVPSILFSLGVIILSFLLGKKLSGHSSVGLLTSFFMSITPWFFIFSRTGYEATAGLFFYLLSIYLFINKFNGKLFFLGIISLILSYYSYNSFRIISPLTLVTFLFFYFIKPGFIIKDFSPGKIFKMDFIYITISIIILLISFLPIYRLYKYDAGSTRLILLGSPVQEYFKNYLSHFEPTFLFFKGDNNPRSQQSGFGQLLLPDIVFLSLGTFFILRNRIPWGIFILFLLALGPVPAAITKESPHALRSISMIPFFALISAYGLWRIVKLFNRKIIIYGVIVLYSYFFINYFIRFVTSYRDASLFDWQFPYKEIFINYSKDVDKYDRIIISDKYAQPYIFSLFYLKYDPEKFRNEVERNPASDWGFSTVKKFGKFEFIKSPEMIILKK